MIICWLPWSEELIWIVMLDWTILSLLIQLDHKKTTCQNLKNQDKKVNPSTKCYLQNKAITKTKTSHDQKALANKDERAWAPASSLPNPDTHKLPKTKCFSNQTEHPLIHSKLEMIEEILPVRVLIIMEVIAPGIVTVKKTRAFQAAMTWNKCKCEAMLVGKERWAEITATNNPRAI